MKNMIEELESRQLMATFTVTSYANSGAGTLRDAITKANATTAADVIKFKIGTGGEVGIGLFSPLDVTNPVTIDATTQPGYAGVPLVRLNDFGSAAYALKISGEGSVVRGLSITGFGNPTVADDGAGIIVNAKSIIEKNYVGLLPNGASYANEGSGIVINAANTTVRDNVISGNGKDGVYVDADYAVFTGNIIGLNPAGNAARPNGQNGIRVQTGYDSQIFGQNSLNVISANGQAGILLATSWANARILGNYIGVSKTGNAKFANGTYGVQVNGSSGTLIGNANVGNRFGGSGVYITGNGQSNHVRSNTFGVGVNPIFNVGGSIGINVDKAIATDISGNIVGNVTTGIRVVGDYNKVYQQNYVGVTKNGAAIPTVLGITMNGDHNQVEANYVSNASTYGIWLIAGQDNVLRNTTWNNGQSVVLSKGANSDIPKALIHSITQQVDGTYKANVSGVFATKGIYRFAFYSNDTAGNTLAGDTQRLLFYTDRTMFVGGQGFDAIISKGLLDGQYLTVQVMKNINNGFNGTGGEPSVAVKVVGRPVVYSSSFDTNTQSAWNFQFSADVKASLKASDLTIRNTATNATYQPTSVTLDASTNTARFSRSTQLPDGNYIAVIGIGAVASSVGANIQMFTLNFTVKH